MHEIEALVVSDAFAFACVVSDGGRWQLPLFPGQDQPGREACGEARNCLMGWA